MNDLKDRETKVAEVDEEIEKEMTIVGTTAIEDKLQDQVKDSIEFMRRAGIKVWVLTGDKVGTAKMIGLTTGLLEPEPAMKQYEITDEELKR